jgi:hypothetical protein
MISSTSRWRRFRVGLMTGLATPVLGVLATAVIHAQPAQIIPTPQTSAEIVPAPRGAPLLPPQPAAPPAPEPGDPITLPAPGQTAQATPSAPTTAEQSDCTILVLNLHQCREMALEKQPSVAAARNSLAAAEARYQAICNLRYVAILERDHKIRKEQGSMGVEVYRAAVVQAESETIYAVTRLYIAAVYARVQTRMLDKAKERLLNVQKLSPPELQPKIDAYLGLLKARQAEAIRGEARSLAALHEAIGLGCDAHLQIVDTQLPDLGVAVDCKEIIDLALARRGEVVQADLGAVVACKEVDAQNTSCFPQKKTFASASDIHAKIVPGGLADGEYIPGALAPEMPPFLIGSRCDRVNQARALADRAGDVAQKVRNLIRLEADNHVLKLAEYRDELEALRKGAADANDYVTKLGKAGAPSDQILDAGVLLTQLQGSRNEAHYRFLLELAALERITVGGFNPGLDMCEIHQP